MEKRPEFCQIVPLKQRQDELFPIDEYVELPNCPLCIGRLDASVTGIPSSKCDHESEICMCFSKWTRNNNCKVCNMLLIGNSEKLSCSECSSGKDSLWLCIVCSFLGCGRYDQGHARKHYQANPSHRFAIDTEFQRIWDYSSERYVHRVIHFVSQNRIVDFPGPSVPSEFSREFYSECKEKQQRVNTSSSSSQPEIQNTRQERELERAIEQLEELQLRTTKAESALEAQEANFYAQRIKIEHLEKENEMMRSQIATLKRELEGERALSNALSNQIHQLNTEKQDLQEQNKDLLTHFEMSFRINEETSNGDLQMLPVPSSHQKRSRRPRK
jgi:BRCA1-associated protein